VKPQFFQLHKQSPCSGFCYDKFRPNPHSNGWLCQ
jgi:hypothetical protein